MDRFPQTIKFKFPWRTYQEAVLTELEDHLDDDHLHVVAPPGSGKTILGLEVMLRINKPTLILSPSITIRNQWIERFRSMFLQTDQFPDWISTDIRNPGFLTITTYQGLHAVDLIPTIEEEEENGQTDNEDQIDMHEVLEKLQSMSLGTLVIDEAHHLKNTWWKSLNELKKRLKPTIVALTATPPYDVSPQEWERYQSLNGPVDAEISVPELVKAGDLCPHQDYIMFSRPNQVELDKIQAYRLRIDRLYKEILDDPILTEALTNHQYLTEPAKVLESIYSNLEVYTSFLVFLNQTGHSISRYNLKVLGDKRMKLPLLNYSWLEIVLSYYLYSDDPTFEPNLEHKNKLIHKLKQSGAIERRKIRFSQHRTINSSLGSSLSKLRSIERIVAFEHEQLKDGLRMVVLTDYIRKEFLTTETRNDLALNKIGVVPIFEQIRRSGISGIKLGILTGSLMIVPQTAVERLQSLGTQFSNEKINVNPLPYDPAYCVVNITSAHRQNLVQLLTQIFQEGHIQVLIGTKSLLGEGWDAPAINSLILATFVGSFVLSNQMRGRAIRTNRLNPEKTGNIWHLVCVDPTSEDGGEDVQLLHRRFRAFVGVSFDEEPTIESGLYRLDVPPVFHDSDVDERLNELMLKKSAQREDLRSAWNMALQTGGVMVEEIKVPYRAEGKDYQGAKSMYFWKTIRHTVVIMGFSIIGYGQGVLEGLLKNLHRIKTYQDLKMFLLAFGSSGILFFGRMGIKTLRLYVRHRDISLDLKQIGEALLATMMHTGHVSNDYAMRVVADKDRFGGVYCHLDGGSRYDKATFIKALSEIVGPVGSPRYVIIRKSLFLKTVGQKDYHAVPEILMRKKQYAEYFLQQWKRTVGAAQLVYTRTPEGRKLLLKSRIKSLASNFQDPTERISKWK